MSAAYTDSVYESIFGNIGQIPQGQQDSDDNTDNDSDNDDTEENAPSKREHGNTPKNDDDIPERSNNRRRDNTGIIAIAKRQNVGQAYDWILTDGDVSSDIYDNAAASFFYLPQWVQNLFLEKDWTLIISSNDFWSDWGFSNVVGMTYYEEQTITVRADSGATSRDCIWHEMGHFVDQYLGFPSQTSDFASITDTEGQRVKDCFNWDIAEISPTEYFAEASYFYWDRPHILEAVAPLTYSYLSDILN